MVDGSDLRKYPRPARTEADLRTTAVSQYRIYGDNILECEKTLMLVADSIAPQRDSMEWTAGPSYAPTYVVSNKDVHFEIQLFPGYERWKYDVQKHFRELGAPLREATDGVLLQIGLEPNGDRIAVPKFAVEFCGALPAGNNAWQRCGRAIACAYARVPYLYFAELGGIELDSTRHEVAPRFPNPLVPFAYLCLQQSTDSIASPVFLPSPSMSANLGQRFEDCFGEVEGKDLVKALLLGKNGANQLAAPLHAKTLLTTRILADFRRRAGTLVGDEWAELASRETGLDKARWLISKQIPWSKRATISTLTGTFRALLDAAVKAGAVAAGSSEMPLCLIDSRARPRFAELVAAIYRSKLSDAFLGWLSTSRNPLVIVWVCGFKPRGDDSRPDRGLVPLARMVFGAEGIDYLTVVYGPAKAATWARFSQDLRTLAETNGLWEAVVSLSDGILVDSSTATALSSIGVLVQRQPIPERGALNRLIDATDVPVFGEHDVDTTLHTLFANATDLGVFEGMCNPPGGDWSGISFQASDAGEIVRWTSLPRVSGDQAKRPDHVVIFHGYPAALISLESKDTADRVEPGIGPRLVRYIEELFRIAPNIARPVGVQAWRAYSGTFAQLDRPLLSGAAFRYRTSNELGSALIRAEVNIVLAVEFIPGQEQCLLHVMTSLEGRALETTMRKLSQRFGGRIKIQIH